jgi:tRNA 2-thiouridine synthesizing protein A
MSIEVDARGRSCPEPVIMTKRAIEENPGEKIEVLVDANVAVENITRFSEGLGYKVSVVERDEEFTLEISK